MAERAVIRLEVKSGEARAKLEQVEQGLEEIDIAAVEVGDGFERMSNVVVQEVTESRAEIQSMASATRDMASASSTANNLTFELTNQLQDMQAAGIQGATNAIPMISEQFLRLKNQAGSTTGALSQMLSTFTGPTGILAIGTLGLQALPSIIDFFSGVREEAEKTAEEVEQSFSDVAEAITDFQQFEIAGVSIGPQDVGPAIQQLREERRRIQSRLQVLRDQLEEEQQRVGRGAAAQQQFQRQTSDIRAQISQLEKRDDQASNFIDKLETQRQKYRQQLDLRRLITENTSLAVDEQGTLTEETGDTADEAERISEALQEIQRISAAIGGTMQQDRAGAVLADPQRDLRANLRQSIQDSRLVGSDRELGRRPIGLSPSAQGLQAARAAGIIDEFQKFPELLDSMEKKQKQTFGQGIQLAAQLGTTLDQAFEQGIDSAEEFAKTVLPLLGQIIGTVAGGPAGGAIGGAAGQIAALPFAEGGEVRGQGGTTEDRIPALLSDREFVMRAAAAQAAPQLVRLINEHPEAAQQLEQQVTQGGIAQPPQANQAVGTTGIGRTSRIAEMGRKQMRTRAADHIPTTRGGTQVVGRQETQDIIKEASSTPQMDMDPVVRKLDEVAARVEQMELRIDTFGLNEELSKVQSEEQQTAVTEYPEA